MKQTVKIHSEVWGNLNIPPKNIFIFLHGMGGRGILWRPHAAVLESNHWILAPDQRGHGKSRLQDEENVLPENFTPEIYGHDIYLWLKEWLSQHPEIQTLNPPVWIIGHSMGVRTACAIANIIYNYNRQNNKETPPPSCPINLGGTILIDLGFSGQAGGGLGKTLGAFLKKLPKHFASRAEAKTFMQQNAPDESIGQYLLAVSTQLPDGSVSFPFHHKSLIATIEAAQNSNVRQWISEFSKEFPVLALRGETSKVWTLEEFNKEIEFFQKHPECKITFYTQNNTGHGLPFEKRVEFLKLVESFIEAQK